MEKVRYLRKVCDLSYIRQKGLERRSMFNVGRVISRKDFKLSAVEWEGLRKILPLSRAEEEMHEKISMVLPGDRKHIWLRHIRAVDFKNHKLSFL